MPLAVLLQCSAPTWQSSWRPDRVCAHEKMLHRRIGRAAATCPSKPRERSLPVAIDMIARAPAPRIDSYWSLPADELLSRLRSSAQGLSSAEAGSRLAEYGRNELIQRQRLSRMRVLYRQLQSPLLLLLFVAAAVSLVTREWVDAGLVLAILAASVGIGASREYSAESAAAALNARIRTRTTVVRDGKAVRIPLEEVVPGDLVLLAAGSLVPADSVVLEASDCHVNEAVLTGESFATEKRPGSLPVAAPLAQRSNALLLGSNVRSGTARCVVVATGAATEFGAIANRLLLRPPENEFDRGLRQFGYLLTKVMLTMALLVFVAHMLLGHPPIETLLFAIALAVGLSPELLPAILSINLARGARMMATRGVLVRRLNAIENLGSMDVLCTDKTGTLTEGVVRLGGAYGPDGVESARVLELAALNARVETGLPSPLDDAILEAHLPELGSWQKRAEVPFDFVRKRVSVVLQGKAGVQLVAKGAVRQVLDVCTRLPDGTPLDSTARATLEQLHCTWTGQGFRVVAVATRMLSEQPAYGRSDEQELTLEGFLTFLDRPKPGAREALQGLARLGVQVKIITGDARLVAEHVAGLVGISAPRVLTGANLDELHDEALWREAERTDLFVEVDPNQKERIILSLKKLGHVVGFLGDGVNDAPAMHAADTSLSVDGAVDVAREAADFVLLEKDLAVLRHGIEEGRRTFANTLKYISTTTSANLGNMLSMALASPLLPFLPLTAGQILLNNFLSDIPAIGLADDGVDPEIVAGPRRWDMKYIQRFMLEFGLLSSVFDWLTFGILLFGFRAQPEEFRTGWFVQSLLTELVIALVVRTRRVFYRSRPGRVLWVSSLVLSMIALAIPYLPGVEVLGFVPLPLQLLLALLSITALYVAAAEVLKRWFYRRTEAQGAEPLPTSG
jgi:Mg2+-importing ATPase